MTIYEGRRTIDGLVVTVDDRKLDEHYEVKRFTRFGFEWTYEGESPQQLALAILFDRLANKERAIQLSEPFMKTVIANLDNDWKLTGEEIDAFNKINLVESNKDEVNYIEITVDSRNVKNDATLVADDGLHPSGLARPHARREVGGRAGAAPQGGLGVHENGLCHRAEVPGRPVSQKAPGRE